MVAADKECRALDAYYDDSFPRRSLLDSAAFAIEFFALDAFCCSAFDASVKFLIVVSLSRLSVF